MSRSRRNTPVFGITTASSEAFDKAAWHQAFRRAENQRLSSKPETNTHHYREFSDPWLMQKDGKYWRRDAVFCPSEMRK